MVSSEPQVATRPAWLSQREHANEWGEHTRLLSQRKRVLFSGIIYYLLFGKEEALFQNNQSTSQDFLSS